MSHQWNTSNSVHVYYKYSLATQKQLLRKQFGSHGDYLVLCKYACMHPGLIHAIFVYCLRECVQVVIPSLMVAQ